MERPSYLRPRGRTIAGPRVTPAPDDGVAIGSPSTGGRQIHRIVIVLALALTAACHEVCDCVVTPPTPPPPPAPPPAPGVPRIVAPAVTVFDEDDEGRAPLEAIACTHPQWSLGTPSRPDLVAELDGDTVVARFGPDASGNGSIGLALHCDEGDPTTALAFSVTPQPDLDYELHELAGADSLLSPILVRVNDVDHLLQPGGGRLQLRTGSNRFELTANAGWRALQVWQVNGFTIPLNENALIYNLILPSPADGGHLVLRVLHATAHDWYRAGATSETDVRALYWDQRSGTGYQGFVGAAAVAWNVYSPPAQPPFQGQQVCVPSDDAHLFAWQEAIDSVLAGWAGLPRPFNYWIVPTTDPIFINALTPTGFNISNGASLACEAAIASPELLFETSAVGQRMQFVARIPVGAGFDAMVDILWRLPRRLGVRVTGSAWVSSGRTPGPSDRELARYIFPVADSALARNFPPLRF